MLSSSDGSLTLPMTCETIEGINLGSAPSQTSDSIATKGSLINGNGGITEAGFADAIANTFWVTAWDNAAIPSRIIPDQVMSGYTTADGKYQKVMYRTKDVSGKTLSVPYWMTMQPQTVSGASEPADDEYIWTKDEVKTFYAYANLPESGASVTNGSAAVQTLTYNVPATAAAQTDILMGFYSGNGNSGSPAVMTGTAGIVFSHPLTAVIFKAGDLNGAKINSISIEGVYASGTAEMTPESAAESDAKDRVIWTPSTTEPTTTTVSQTISTQPAAAGDQIGEAFLLIPQDFTGNTSALIVIDVTFGGTRQNIYCPLGGQNWKAGYTYNYLINYDNNGYVLFDAPTQHTVKLAITGTMPDCTIEYSTDAKTWNEYTIGTNVSFGGADGKVLFRGTNNATALDGSNYHHFVFDDGTDGTAADVIVSGNAMGLLDKSLANVATWKKNYMLFALFYGCKPLKDAGSLLLPMTKLSSQYGYAYMFYGCSNLRTAPELPATSICAGIYQYMFGNCTSLVNPHCSLTPF